MSVLDGHLKQPYEMSMALGDRPYVNIILLCRLHICVPLQIIQTLLNVTWSYQLNQPIDMKVHVHWWQIVYYTESQKKRYIVDLDI